MSSSTPPQRVLVACIGNIFLGDDGFGVEVAQRLMRRGYPRSVEVIDFGIRGVELAYSLLDDYDELILVDAVPRGGSPGTLYLLEIDMENIPAGDATHVALDAHSMDPVRVLAFARVLGARSIHTLLVGCEPAILGSGGEYEDMQVGLSAPVQAALAGAVKMVDGLIEQWYTLDRNNPVEKGKAR
jgi:hydrogenase maturation protease